MSVRDQVVVITGASKGFGRETAVACVHAGYTVVATMRNLKDATELQTRAAGAPGSLVYLSCDVTSASSMDSCIQEVATRFQRIDVLINNAGFGLFGPVELATMEQIRAQMETNFFGVVGMTQRVLPHMRARRSGLIINIGSMAGRIAMPCMGYYNSSKFAVEGFTEALRYEVAPLGIRVAVVEPGRFETEFSKALNEVPPSSIDFYGGMQMRMKQARQKFRGPSPKPVVDCVLKIMSSPAPRLRYIVGKDAWAGYLLTRLFPQRALDWIFRKIFFRT